MNTDFVSVHSHLISSANPNPKPFSCQQESLGKKKKDEWVKDKPQGMQSQCPTFNVSSLNPHTNIIIYYGKSMVIFTGLKSI